MIFNSVALVLGVTAAIFVLWPLFALKKGSRNGDNDNKLRDETNAALYREHLKDLQLSVDRGDIPKEQFEPLKLGLQRNLLEDSSNGDKLSQSSPANSKILLVVALLIPLLATFAYQQLGAAPDWEIFKLAEQRRDNPSDNDTVLAEQLRDKLNQRTKARPENTQNWYLLAALSLEQQDPVAAIRAYRAILEQQPHSPQIMAELAQLLFIQADSQVTNEARQYVLDALQLDPNLTTALGLAGIDAFQNRQFKAAIGYWERAIGQLGPEAPGAQILAGGIAKAQEALNAKPPASDVQDGKTTGAKVSVSVSLASSVKVEPTDTVFIYARAWQGPKMPLAISRVQAADLPLTVELDQNMAMAPGMDITRFEQLELVARISKDGNASAQKGDWQAQAGPIRISDLNGPVELLIEQQIP